MKFTWLEDSDNRLDTFYAWFDYTSRSIFARAIDEGLVTVNDKTVKRNYKLTNGDRVEIQPMEDENITPKDLNIDILYEDDHILMINKPPFLAVHPAKSFKGDTVVHWLLHYGCKLSDGEDENRPGIVHRLDADTTGVLLIAKDNRIHQKLKEMFQNHKVRKQYIAIVHGLPKEDTFTIQDPIGRGNNPTKMAVVTNGRNAITHVHVLKRAQDFSLLELEIETGRTHQIRVHLSHKGFPIVGDPVYGRKKEKITAKRQMLHAKSLRFQHPVLKKELHVEAPLPNDFKEVGKKTLLI
ncbi:MAG: RluA family pseudouridine synthase [Tissierellia bacterium]|nr:RluA family pseudouridine synthase [Tissierellia bacterium]